MLVKMWSCMPKTRGKLNAKRGKCQRLIVHALPSKSTVASYALTSSTNERNCSSAVQGFTSH